MNIAFILFEGMTMLDFVGVYDPLTRLKTMDFMPDLCWNLVACQEEIRDSSGLGLHPDKIRPSLANYDLVIVPGGGAAGN